MNPKTIDDETRYMPSRPNRTGARLFVIQATNESLFDRTRGILGDARELVVLVSLFLILAKDYFWIVSGLRVEWLGIGAIALLFAYSNLTKPQSFQINGGQLLVASLLLFSWIGSSAVVSAPNGSSYYAAFAIAAMIIGIRSQRLVQSLTLIVSVNLVIQMVEFFTGDFLFAYVVDDIEYDEVTLSVGDETLRAKGFFTSPLNAISVAMSLAFLQPKSPLLWFMVVVSSVLGQGRLGLGVGLLGLAVCLLSKLHLTGHQRRNALISIGGAIVVMFVWASYLASEEALQRMLEALSLDNSQNLSRLYFWGRAIDELTNYPAINVLFGRPGYIKALEGGTESDWLRIWLDNGVFCVLAFAIPLLKKLVRSVATRSATGVCASVLCIFVMAVFPHAQSMPNGTLTWLLFISSLRSEVFWSKPRDLVMRRREMPTAKNFTNRHF